MCMYAQAYPQKSGRDYLQRRVSEGMTEGNRGKRRMNTLQQIVYMHGMSTIILNKIRHRIAPKASIKCLVPFIKKIIKLIYFCA